jgi:hypothetical protein
LKKHAGKPTELALVRGLAAQKFMGSGSSTFVKRLEAVSVGTDRVLLDAWLELIEPWKGKPSRYAPVFLRLAEAAAKSPADSARLTILLSNVGTLRRLERDVNEPLEVLALAALSGGEAQQQVAACTALGVVAGKEGSRALQRVLEEPGDPRVRQAALHALARRKKKSALPDVVRAGQDPLLTADAIVLLRRLGDPDALPFLSKIASDHYNRWTRKLAASAIRAIEKKKKKKKSG